MPVSKASRKPSPIRIPSGPRSSYQQAASNLKSEQIHDIWEHAALLYRGYEWQAAADAFDLLSRNTENIEERTLCLLNFGLIQARLGDRDGAVNTFEETSALNPTLLITSFLIALVSCDLGDYAKAEACIETCLDGLAEDDIDYRTMGLNFVLSRASLLHALREIRTAQFHAALSKEPDRVAVRIDSIPAEYIFEAPPRLGDSAEIAEESPRRSMRPRKLFKGGKMPESMINLRTSAGRGASVLTSPYWLHDPRSPSSPLHIYQEGLSDIPENSAASISSTQVSPATNVLSSSEPTSANSSKYRTWHRRPSTPFTPRDARVEFGSVRELARFFRHSGEKKPAKLLIPKDARGEYESVEELSRFVQLYAPEKTNDIIPQPLNIDARVIVDLRMERILNRKGERAASSPVSESVLNGDTTNREDSVRAHRARDSPVSPNPYSVPYSPNVAPTGNEPTDTSATRPMSRPSSDPYSLPGPSDPDQPTLEVLQPLVYKPPAPKNQAAQRCSERTSNSPTHTDDQPTPATTASSTSSLHRGATSFERRIMARQNTLKALEGRTNEQIVKTTKPLPPSPGAGHSGSSVATEDFFDRVLERGKKPST